MSDSVFMNNLTLLILFAGVFFSFGMLFWRGQVQGQKAQQQIQHLQKQLDASFALNGYLLEAHDEKAVILAAMRTGQSFLEAEGCAFVPFNEWKQTLPVLQHGELSFLKEPDWQMRLSTSATRHTCRNCESRQAGSECILLQQVSAAENVYCLALRCGGREIGVVNYFFSKPPHLLQSRQPFLGQIVRMTDLALDAMRFHAQEIEVLRAVQKPAANENKLLMQNAENQSILEQLKYQAVLDERTRLAREIHDGLAQTLAFLKMEAARMQNHLAKNDTALLEESFQTYYRTLSEAYLDARQAIDDLRYIPDERLAEWLVIAASEFADFTGLSVDASNIQLDYVFSKGMKAQLIRIVQEALTNIRKHSQACTVSISAVEHGGEVVIEVKDNGRGFSTGEVDSTSQYGLRSMRERAESIRADLQVISAPGMGTTMRLQVPIREKANL